MFILGVEDSLVVTTAGTEALVTTVTAITVVMVITIVTDQIAAHNHAMLPATNVLTTATAVMFVTNHATTQQLVA